MLKDGRAGQAVLVARADQVDFMAALAALVAQADVEVVVLAD